MSFSRLLAVFAVLLPAMCLAQTLRPRFGIYGGYDINRHTADFRELPGVPNCCPRFEEGTGSGPAAGALAELPLTSRFFLNLRLGYMSHDALLTAEESTTILVNGTRQTGAFKHTVDAHIATFGIEPMVSWNATGTSGLYIHVGFRMATLMKNFFSQKEEISQPADAGTFIDSNGLDTRSRVRNEFAGDIPNASTLHLSLVAGLSYELPLNTDHTLFLAPEAFYFYGLTPVVENLAWHAHAIRAGLALKYWPKIIDKPIVRDTLIVRDTSTRSIAGTPLEHVVLLNTSKVDTVFEDPLTRYITTVAKEHYERQMPKTIVLTVNTQVFGVEGNKESPAAQIRIEEFLSSRLHPLLNFIFFNEAEASIPQRYHFLTPAETNKFTIDGLFGKSTLEIYYDLLNIVGLRMRQFPDAAITITGCNSMSTAKASVSLSRNRAEAIRQYLHDVWGIDDSRMKVEARELPESPSNPRTPDGIAENRRAEITASRQEILDPIFASDTLRITDPPKVRIKPNIISSEGIDRWSLDIRQQGRVIKTFEGTGKAPIMLDWRPSEDQQSIPVKEDALLITTHVVDVVGTDRILHATLPLEQITLQKKRVEKRGDKEVDIFNLILFDFDKSELNASNLHIVEFIKSKLAPNALVTISGYTDRTGDEAYNKKLSADRSETVRRELGLNDATVVGRGEEQLLYDNEYPEGRFYCRTVQIVAEKTIK